MSDTDSTIRKSRTVRDAPSSGLDDSPCYDDLDGANAEEARLWDEFQAASKRRAEVVAELRSRERAAQDAWAKAYENRCSLRRQLTEMRERNSHHNASEHPATDRK